MSKPTKKGGFIGRAKDYQGKGLDKAISHSVKEAMTKSSNPKIPLDHFFIDLTNAPEATNMTLPTESQARKDYPLLSGVLRYFPAALAGVAKTSKAGNDKHNPGEEMHHARGKSPDHGDCIVRHLVDVQDLLAKYERAPSPETKDAILLELGQLAWRALAYSQDIHEKLGAPMAPGAKLYKGEQ